MGLYLTFQVFHLQMGFSSRKGENAEKMSIKGTRFLNSNFVDGPKILSRMVVKSDIDLEMYI